MTESFSLHRKAATHDFEIRHLYEEMEQQIKKEKDKIVLQVKQQFRRRNVSELGHTIIFVFFWLEGIMAIK